METQFPPWVVLLVQVLVTSGVISGVVSGLVALWVKSKVDRELEEAKTRFSWLYQARAKAMLAMYDQIIAVETLLEAFVATNGLEPSDASIDRMLKAYGALVDGVKRLDAIYKPQRLLFSTEIAATLDDLSATYHGVLKTFDDFMDDPDIWYQMVPDAVQMVANNPIQTGSLLQALEGEFRAIYDPSKGRLETHVGQRATH